MKIKRPDFYMQIKAVVGKDGTNYVVFKTPKGSYHAFSEVEAKQIAREFGIRENNTRMMWNRLWKKLR